MVRRWPASSREREVPVKRLIAIVLLMLFAWQTDANAQSANSVSSKISAAKGGVVALPGVATVLIGPNGLPADTTVTAEATTSERAACAYADTLIPVAGRLPYEVRIEVGARQPFDDGVAITLEVPQYLRSQAGTSNDVTTAFVLVDIHDIVTLESITYRPEGTGAVVQLPAYAFYTNDAGQSEAMVMLVLTPR